MKLPLCCAAALVGGALALAGCASTSSGPSGAALTAPNVGRPAAPASVAAALATEPLTAYITLGDSAGNSLAPNEALDGLQSACMADAGFAGDGKDVLVPVSVPLGTAGGPPWGQWGYLGPVPALTASSPSAFTAPAPTSNPSAAEQLAANKCSNVLNNFTKSVDNGPLAGVQTMSTNIRAADNKDPSIAAATKDWAACMTTNGYNYADPTSLVHDMINYGALSGTQKSAQHALTAADAHCTQTSDLAGIFFAVQAGYEQQTVDANQQALTTAVHDYRAAYQQELTNLPTLLATASTSSPFGPVNSH